MGWIPVLIEPEQDPKGEGGWSADGIESLSLVVVIGFNYHREQSAAAGCSSEESSQSFNQKNTQRNEMNQMFLITETLSHCTIVGHHPSVNP